jgi:hypothetical protein
MCSTTDKNPFEIKSDEDLLLRDDLPSSSIDNENHTDTQLVAQEKLDEIISNQKPATSQVIRVIRKRAWEFYTIKCNNKWFRQTANISAYFTGEEGAGDGVNKEFFEGNINH